jgi:hypothetical protein
MSTNDPQGLIPMLSLTTLMATFQAPLAPGYRPWAPEGLAHAARPSDS